MFGLNKEALKRTSTYLNMAAAVAGSVMVAVPELVPEGKTAASIMLGCSICIALAQAVTTASKEA